MGMIGKGPQQQNARITRVAHVTREYRSLAGAGGIKDVADGLARASAKAGIETHVFLPHYTAVDTAIEEREKKGEPPLVLEQTAVFDVPMNYAIEDRKEAVSIRSATLEPNLTIHLVDARRYKVLSEGDGTIKRIGIYTYEKDEAAALERPELKGKGYQDFFAMNVLLVKATLHYLGKKDVRPDVIHCHDGHTSTLPLLAQEASEGYAAFLRHTPSLITIHNAGRGYHQEVEDLDFARRVCGLAETKKDAIAGCRLEGSFDPLLAGGMYGSAINTVSENYARELQHTGQDWMTAWLGHALAERGVTLHGVTNGVDPGVWNPEKPAPLCLDATFSVVKGDLKGKETCKRTLVEALSRGDIPVDDPEKKLSLEGKIEYRRDTPLLTFIGRLDQQKGFDVLAEALFQLFAEDENVQLLGLGSGDPAIQKQFLALADAFPGRVGLVVGYSDDFAAKVYAAGDFFVIPSRFEPCGLTDFFAQLMGNLPIVHAVGGLVKTLDDRFGYSYLGGALELLGVLRRALDDYRESGRGKIRRMQKDAVENVYNNFTWQKVLEKKYLPLYQLAIDKMKPLLPY